MHVGLYWWLWRQSNCKDLDDAQRWQPPASRDRNENRPQEGEGGGTRPEAEEPRTARGHGGKAGEHTKRTHKTQARPNRARGRPATGESKRGNEARQNRRTDGPTDTKTTRRDDSERTNEGEGKERQKPTQPTALKIISALSDCSTLLYCCQAYRIIRARSASSASDAQERTKATVSSAGRPPASKTSGTSSPPEGG